MLRASPGAPIAVGAIAAVATVALATAVLVILWSNPTLWWRASAATPLLSTWGFAAALQLLAALVIIVPALRPERVDLGLARRQIFWALGIGLAVWSAGQLAALVDVACSRRVPAPAIDVLGDALGAYGEEVVYRVVVLGALATALRGRLSERRTLVIAVLGSALVFWAGHLPRDVVTGAVTDPARFVVLVSHGALLAGVYLSSGNVMLAAVTHALGNGPMLVIAGAHHVAATTTTNWLCCVGVVLWYQRRLRRAP